MMKGIYFSEGLKFDGAANVGIEEKVCQQIKCLKSIGGLVVVNSDFPDTMKDKIKFLLPVIASERERERDKLLKVVDSDIDYIYIRKPSLTIKFYKLLRKIKKRNPKTYIMLEIPTYPFHFEYDGLSRLMVLKSIHCEKKLNKVIDKVITYSDDDEIWGIPTLKMSNCVNYDKIPIRSKKYKIEPKTVRLTCVANFMYWHGVDRLIKGMKNFKGDYRIVLNIVGEGCEIEKLRYLARGMDNVVFHGVKIGKDLDEIFNKTDIAVDALGRHRSGVYYNSSLKGKEYSARGIPIISAVKTELDRIPDYRYYLKLPSDDSYIDMNCVIGFYEDIYLSHDVDVISRIIREKTMLLFDYKDGFKNIIKEELGGLCRVKK